MTGLVVRRGNVLLVISWRVSLGRGHIRHVVVAVGHRHRSAILVHLLRRIAEVLVF
jgi:hypothetical protein